MITDQEIIDNAPGWADTHRKLLSYPDCTTYANNADDEQVLDRSLVDIKRIAELEDLLKKFRPRDEDGDGWDFIYNEGSEYLGEAVLKALKEQIK